MQENYGTSKGNERCNSPERLELFTELFIAVKLFREHCILSATDLAVIACYAMPSNPINISAFG